MYYYTVSKPCILDYGANVGGHKQFPCAEAQLRAIRSFLGLNSKSSNTAIMGDMGWTPQNVPQSLSISRQCIRYSQMEDSHL